MIGLINSTFLNFSIAVCQDTNVLRIELTPNATGEKLIEKFLLIDEGLDFDQTPMSRRLKDGIFPN